MGALFSFFLGDGEDLMESKAASSEILGSASYVFTEDEFIAACRAAGIARFRLYDTWVSRSGVMAFGYVFLLGGIAATVIWLTATEGADGPMPGAAVALLGVIAAIACWVLYRKIHFYRKGIAKAYRESPYRDGAFEYQFTPSRLIFRGRESEGSLDWSLAQKVAELRDGFDITWYPGGAGTFIPNHALRDPFGPDDLASLLRSKVKKYRVINRAAALPKP